MDGTNDEFGVIVSLKDLFGFIQPFLKEEQIYFSLRDMRTPVNLGDIVCYHERPSAKGLNAEGVRLIPVGTATAMAGTVTGTVIREPDSARRVPGIALVSSHDIVDAKQVKVSLPSQISFVLTADNTSTSRATATAAAVGSASPTKAGGTKRIMKGDEIRFELLHIPNQGFYQGRNAAVVRTRKELQMLAQVQRMLDAGASQEIGIVDTLKGDYGFIRPQNRKEQIYFRVSDLLDQEARIEQVAHLFFNNLNTTSLWDTLPLYMILYFKLLFI